MFSDRRKNWNISAPFVKEVLKHTGHSVTNRRPVMNVWLWHTSALFNWGNEGKAERHRELRSLLTKGRVEAGWNSLQVAPRHDPPFAAAACEEVRGSTCGVRRVREVGEGGVWGDIFVCLLFCCVFCDIFFWKRKWRAKQEIYDPQPQNRQS